MRQIRLILLLTLIDVLAYGQNGDIDLAEIKFKGLGFLSTKEQIIKSFERPNIIETNYECGAFTNDQAGGPYYLLDYTEFDYIGSDKETFSLHEIEFDKKGVTRLHLGERDLSGLTTVADFIKIFGDKVKDKLVNHSDHDTFLLYSKESDDGVVFTFKNGRLSKFEYWTPC